MKGSNKNSKGKSRRNNRHSMESKNVRRDVEIRNTADREMKADDRIRRDCFKSQANDPAWYAQNPQLIRDYASFPFGQALGSKTSLLETGRGVNAYAIPGIAAFYFSPTVGNPTDANAPINVAMRNIYSFVRHANSGHSNYDAPDLMMYLLAMDSVYMYHSFLKRILGLMLDYTTMNRYYPMAIVQAMGVDFDDISHHIQDFRGFINQFAVNMGSMCVPNSMSYMARHTWMCEGLYTDGTTSKAQTYFYTPDAYLQFSRNSSTQVGQLDYVAFIHPYLKAPNQELHKYADLVSFGRGLLNPILQEEDFNIMSGDILKAFGPEGVVRVSGVAEGYMILPQYNMEVLSQMENATVFNGYFNNSIVQDTSVDGGYLKLTGSNFTQVISASTPRPTTAITLPQANGFIYPYYMKHVLNFHKSEVTPEDVMVATRLTNVISPYTTAPTLGDVTTGIQLDFAVPTVASEIVTAGLTWFYYWLDTGKMVLLSKPMSKALYSSVSSSTNGASAIDTANVVLGAISMLSNFDWHPAVVPVLYVMGSDAVTSVPVSDWLVSDKDYYTVIDRSNLENMTTAALLSEFSVPQMGAFATKL